MLLRSNTQTRSDRLRADTLLAIQSIMLEVVGHEPTLLTVVANGHQNFRNYVLQQCRGLAINDDIADKMFAFFCRKVQQRYGGESAGQVAGKVLDKLEVPSPPTQREIDESWEAESFSSEEGRRYFYGPDGHPEELIKKLQVN